MAEFSSLPVRERMRLILERARREGDAEVLRELEAAERLLQANPLQDFEPHSGSQRDFFEAKTPVIAAFAGNQFGKTTSLIVRALIEVLDRDVLPARLREYKKYDAPVHGWIVCPTTDKMYDQGGMIPCLQQWCPPSQLLSGQWSGAKGGAWSKERRTVTFANGSTIAFKTYEQHESTLGGAQLHFVGYDEPPPLRHREECLTRLLRYGGYEMFAMTPLQTNTGWIRRDIYRQRESPDITVIRGSMHDNPTLDPKARDRILNTYSSDLWRRAREFGDFVDVGGLIYPDFDRCVLEKAPDPEFVRSLDVVVGIDPGIRNTGLIWVGFDKDLAAWVFDELLLQDRTAADYVRAIREVNQRWGLRNVSYVVDPAAKQRAQANGMTVLSEINKAGVFPNLGQNDHELGFGQMRIRMQSKRFWVSPECRGLRDEADDYAAKEPEEGRDDSHLEPIKGNDHRLDALRYACLERFWDPVMEAEAPKRKLGWEPGLAADLRGFSFPGGSDAPMGAMS